MPQAASIGSSGTGSMITFRVSAKVTSTFPPGRSPIRSRSSAGMTTCPLLEVSTMAICVHLFANMFNLRTFCITPLRMNVKVDGEVEIRLLLRCRFRSAKAR